MDTYFAEFEHLTQPEIYARAMDGDNSALSFIDALSIDLTDNLFEQQHIYKRMAERGCPPAMYQLGLVQQDHQLALPLFIQAADAGLRDAQSVLNMMHHTGLRGVGINYALAFKWGLLAAVGGSADDQAITSMCFSVGLSVERNREKAMHFAKLAADSGSADGLYQLGQLHEDPMLRYRYISAAARKGHVEAIAEMARFEVFSVEM
jgi:TPR repeat protein